MDLRVQHRRNRTYALSHHPSPVAGDSMSPCLPVDVAADVGRITREYQLLKDPAKNSERMKLAHEEQYLYHDPDDTGKVIPREERVVLMDWGCILSLYAQKRLVQHPQVLEDQLVAAHLKDTLFVACTRFQACLEVTTRIKNALEIKIKDEETTWAKCIEKEWKETISEKPGDNDGNRDDNSDLGGLVDVEASGDEVETVNVPSDIINDDLDDGGESKGIENEKLKMIMGEVVKLNSDLVELYQEWGDVLLTICIYYNLPFFEMVIEKYQAALDIEPNNTYTLCQLGVTLSEQASSVHFAVPTQMQSKESIMKKSNNYFMKAMEIEPRSHEASIKWAHALEKRCHTLRVFADACILARQIGEKFSIALSVKPEGSISLLDWGDFLDWLSQLLFSSRYVEDNFRLFYKTLSVYLRNYEAVAAEYPVSLSPLLSLLSLPDPEIGTLVSRTLAIIKQTTKVEYVRAEATQHLLFHHTVQESATSLEAPNADRAKTLLTIPPGHSAAKLLKSASPPITLPEATKHYDVLVNCLYFLVDKNEISHPLYKRSMKQASPNRHKKREYSDAEIEGLFLTKPEDDLIKKDNPWNHYSDKMLVGNGGFGDVYSAQNRVTGERVAVKVFRRKLADDTRHIVQEIQTMKKCNLKYIINFEECFAWDDEVSIIMEYCDGGSLRDMCIEVYLNEEEIAYFCRQICEGLRYLHRASMIHRDIKADNILLNLNGNIRIADLGLVEYLEGRGDKPHRLSMVGTCYWMAPEMIYMQPYSQSVDIWALGCVVFELATGSPPYHDVGRLRAMFNTATVGAPQLPSVNTLDTSNSLYNDAGDKIMPWTRTIHAFLDACLQHDPTLRPPALSLLTHPFFLQSRLDLEKLHKKLQVVFLGLSLRLNGLA